MEDPGKKIFGRNVRRFREALSLSQEALASNAGIDRSYMGGVERGERNPSLSAILDIAHALRVPPYRLFDGIGEETPLPQQTSGMSANEGEDALVIGFRYDQFDAEYALPGASRAQYDEILNTMKAGLSGKTKRSHVVSQTFLAAVRVWPDANPSDLWTFLINRAYCDRANHPAANARLNLEQSWKRTGGWALEQVLVNHYSPCLREHGITIRISSKDEKSHMLGTIEDSRIVPDKADILILYRVQDSEQLLGVIHVKGSIAERRTDDVPMSQALIEAGYLSVFWTMDSKSFPSERPVNRGEFGIADDSISDKRRDFEEHGHFSACFSYNKNTIPTPEDNKASSRIFVCDFRNPDDRFARFLVDELQHRLAG
jgi:transcriptional regulator with XRE-family HTH domain